jgi:hypothetical protein
MTGRLPLRVPTALDRLRSVREKLITDGTVVTPDGLFMEIFPVAIGPEEGAALRDLVVEEGATRTLEVGLGFAISTLFICEGLLVNGAGGRHVAIDPFQLTSESEPTAWRILRLYLFIEDLSIHQGFVGEPLVRNVVRDHDGAGEERKVVRDGPIDFDAALSVCSPTQREPCQTPHDAAWQEHEHEPPVDPHGTLTFCCFPEEAPPRMVFMVPEPMPPQTVRAASGLKRRKERC